MSPQTYLERLTAFLTDVVAPQAAGWETTGTAPRQALAEAGRRGLIGIEVPTRLGGCGLDFRTRAAAAEAMARVDFGFAMALINTHNVALKLATHAPPAVAQRWIPSILSGERIACTAITEVQAGSDLTAMTTRAEADGDVWWLTGDKAWLVNGTMVDLAIVYALTDPAAGPASIAAFLVDLDSPGAERDDRYALAAAHSIATGGLKLQDCRAQAMLVPPATAVKSLLIELNAARVYTACMAIGMVAQALESALAWGQARHSFAQPLTAHQGWAHPVAEAAADLAAARALSARAIDAIATHQPSDQPDSQPVQQIAAEAKLVATRLASRHIPALIHAHGAEGLRATRPLTRHLAATAILGLVDGSDEMLKDRILKSLLKQHPLKP